MKQSPRKIRGSRSAMQNAVMDQSSPLAIQPSMDWKFDESMVFTKHHPESNYQGWSFFPSLTIDWHKDFTDQMRARMFAIEDHWKNVHSRSVYQFHNWYAGGRMLKQDELGDAFSQFGRVMVVFYVSLDPSGKHHINKRSLELAYKRYGHLFTNEWLEKTHLYTSTK